MNSQPIQISVPLEFNQLIEIVRQLSPSEKSVLKEVLQQSGDIDDHLITEEHKNIVRQRVKASETDPSRLHKWDEIKHKINL